MCSAGQSGLTGVAWWEGYLPRFLCVHTCVPACLPAHMRCAVDGVGSPPPLIPLLRAHLQGWLPLPAVKLVMQWGLVWFLSTNLSTQWVFGVSFVCRCLTKQIVLHGTKERCSFVQEELLRCQQQIKDIFTPSSRFMSLLQRHIHSRSELVRGTVYRRRWQRMSPCHMWAVVWMQPLFIRGSARVCAHCTLGTLPKT